MLTDYVCYIHTDSLFFQCYSWLKNNGMTDEQWNKLTQNEKLEIVKDVSNEVTNYINKKSFSETQLSHYNSQLKDFKINFEVEKIALSGLFKEKARYAIWTLLADNKWKNNINITGLEVIRSDSPEIIKPMIKKVLEKILINANDKEIKNYIADCKKQLRKCTPSEIAENKGINKINKYLIKNSFKKGTPHQIKGVYYFKYIVNLLGITNKYEAPMNGNKAKVVYIKKNPYNVSSMSFLTWPIEFNKILQVNMEKMIENNFTKKIRNLLKIVNKEKLINEHVDLF